MNRSNQPQEQVLVKVQQSPTGVRDLRDAMVHLVKSLAASTSKRGYLLLIDSQISSASVGAEWDAFVEALRPEVAARLRLVEARDGALAATPKDISGEDQAVLIDHLDRLTRTRTTLPRPSLQAEVIKVMIHEYLAGRGPLTKDWLAKTVGCSYRTVAAAVSSLDPYVSQASDRRIELRSFPHESWSRLVALAPKTRATRLFVDRSDLPRSVESLARRVGRLDRPDIAIGGVLAARAKAPHLDLVSAPRLDLCVHAPDNRATVFLITELDPALEETTDSQQPVRVAVHYLRRDVAYFGHGPGLARWADPVECLLDLHEARLDGLAREFLENLLARRAEAHDGTR